MSTLKELMQEINVKRQTLDEQLKEISGKFFAEHSKVIFEQFPTLKSFSWTQYTPHFNDGDSCTFSVSNEYLKLKFLDEKDQEDEEFDDDEEEDDYDCWGMVKTPEGKYTSKYRPEEEVTDPKKIIAFEVSSFLNEFNDDSMLAMFGDHVRVTVSRDGTVEQDEYEHD